jgi:hypothetical protein
MTDALPYTLFAILNNFETKASSSLEMAQNQTSKTRKEEFN